MYKPVKDGIEKGMNTVVYVEAHPPAQLRELVHCFWELKTNSPLPEDFLYHVIPEGKLPLIQTNNELAHLEFPAKQVVLSKLIEDLIKEKLIAPHDFLKILRVQQSFRQDYLAYYADQAHYIHSFRRITGYTPSKYVKKFFRGLSIYYFL
ncbi:MAG: hypothetical protein ACOYOK_08415 [Pseudobdellovibrionaceae bacterium]